MTISSPADTVVRNCVVRTMDASQPTADSLAIADGKIVYVGPSSGLASFTGPATKTVDLSGRTVLPGLMDVHNHHAIAGQHEAELQFPAESTVPEICAAIRDWVKQHPEDMWVLGSKVGSQLLGELQGSDALKQLDAASGGKKVLLTTDCHHNRWANSAALAAGGITSSTPNPVDGEIVRDSNGQPTGLLYEGGARSVLRALDADTDPSAALEAAKKASAAGIRTMHQMGITGFLDAACGASTLRGLKALDDEGQLKIHACSSMLINDRIFGNDQLGTALFALQVEVRGRHHRPDFAKIFLDGVPMSYTGAFLEPYVQPAGGDGHCCVRGHTTMPYDELEGWLLRCAERGINVKIHCTGDAAVRFVLDAVERVRAAGHKDAIFHVAHGQFVHPSDIGRFAPLGVVADISPPLWFPGAITDAMALVRSEEDMKRFHPNAELLAAGATLAAGSDWPVMPDPNPWTGIASLVTRKDPTGERTEVLNADQSIDLEQAVRAYSINVAKALGLDKVTGSIERGKSADFVVLDRDPFQVPIGKVAGTQTEETWFAGERVYARQ